MDLTDYLLDILTPDCYSDEGVELPFLELPTLILIFLDEIDETAVEDILKVGSVKQALRACVFRSYTNLDFMTEIHSEIKELAVKLYPQVCANHRENGEIDNGRS